MWKNEAKPSNVEPRDLPVMKNINIYCNKTTGDPTEKQL
jgi:hypothetical protein